MVSRYDAVLAAIPAPALAGVLAGWLTRSTGVEAVFPAVAGGVPEATLLTAVGLLGSLLIIYREVFVVGVPE